MHQVRVERARVASAYQIGAWMSIEKGFGQEVLHLVRFRPDALGNHLAYQLLFVAFVTLDLHLTFLAKTP